MHNLSNETFERTISNVIYVMGRCRIDWHICFGSLLGLVRDGGMIKDPKGNPKPTDDIDIGIMYEQMDEKRLLNGFLRFGYRVNTIIRNDYIVASEPFFISFDHDQLPHLDIFAWVKKGKKRYHTYDVHHERKEIPNSYKFKGIKEEWLSDIQRVHLPYLKKYINMPMLYGTLLDCWYPNWLERKNIESTTPWVLEGKSCKEIGI